MEKLITKKTEIDEYLKYEFIPKYVKLKKYKNEETKEEEIYPTIPLKVFQSLDLHMININYICLCLYEAGILIGNKSAMTYYNNFNYSPIVDLDEEEDRSLYLMYSKTGEGELKEQIVEENVDLVKFISFQYSKKTGFNNEELESFGYEGLLKALDRYNPLADESFKHFAYNHIEFAIKIGYANICGFRRNKFFGDFYYAKNYIEKIFDEKIEARLELIDYVLDELVQRKAISPLNYSINKDRISLVYHDSLTEDIISNEVPFEVEVEYVTRKLCLEEAYSYLTEQEILVLELYYGLKDGNRYTLKALSNKLGLSMERIRQIKGEAFLKLRAPHRVRRMKSKLGDVCDIPNNHIVKNVKTGMIL